MSALSITADTIMRFCSVFSSFKTRTSARRLRRREKAESGEVHQPISRGENAPPTPMVCGLSTYLSNHSRLKNETNQCRAPDLATSRPNPDFGGIVGVYLESGSHFRYSRFWGGVRTNQGNMGCSWQRSACYRRTPPYA